MSVIKLYGNIGDPTSLYPIRKLKDLNEIALRHAIISTYFYDKFTKIKYSLKN